VSSDFWHFFVAYYEKYVILVLSTIRRCEMGLKDNIKFKRIENGMTLEELAAKVGVSRQTIQRYESGVIGNIPSDKIELMAAALDTTPASLMGWEKPERTANAMSVVTHSSLMQDIVLECKEFDSEELGRLLSYARFLKQDTSKQGEE